MENTVPSQPGQLLPTPAPPLHDASSWKRPGRGRWRSSKNPSPCARNRTSSILATSTSSSSVTVTPGSGKPVVVSGYFLRSHATSSVLPDAKSFPLQTPHSKASGADAKKLMVKRKRDRGGGDPNKQTEKPTTKKRPYFSASQKTSTAYRRVADNNTWEQYSFDPWKVLIISILLNVTTDIQVGHILPDLFLLCPNAEAMSKVNVEEVEKVIRPLGLQKKRSRTLAEEIFM